MTGRRAVAIRDRGLDVLGRVQGVGGQLPPATHPTTFVVADVDGQTPGPVEGADW